MSKFEVIFSSSSFNFSRFDFSLSITFSGALFKKFSLDSLELMAINSKLSNENFLNRAPENVIDKEKSNLEKLNEELEKITSNLDMLK